MSQPTKPLPLSKAREHYDAIVTEGNKRAAAVRRETGDVETAERVLLFHRNQACNAFTRWLNKWKPPP